MPQLTIAIQRHHYQNRLGFFFQLPSGSNGKRCSYNRGLSVKIVRCSRLKPRRSPVTLCAAADPKTAVNVSRGLSQKSQIAALDESSKTGSTGS